MSEWQRLAQLIRDGHLTYSDEPWFVTEWRERVMRGDGTAALYLAFTNTAETQKGGQE